MAIIEFKPETLIDASRSLNEAIIEKQIKVKDDADLADTVKKVERLAFAMVNDGIDPETGAYMTIDQIDSAIKKVSDATGIGSTSVLTQQVITRGVEHLSKPTPIYQYFANTMSYKTGTQTIIPYIGEATGARDIGPGQELPMLSFDRDAEIISNTGRSGVGISLPEETMRLANYPILKLYLEKAVESLANWKNHKAVATVLATGNVLFDNVDPEASVYGHTTGRTASTGELNGTFTLRDLFAMYMHGIKKGYKFDTVLMSQWGYLIFMFDPTLRKFIEINNGVLFSAVNGKIGHNSRNFIAQQSRGTSPAGAHQSIDPIIPKELMNVNFNIIVTNYVNTYEKGMDLVKAPSHGLNKPTLKYNWKTELTAGTEKQKSVANVDFGASPTGASIAKCGANPMTDIVMLDSSNALMYMEEEKVKTDKKIDNMKECTEIYLRERYTFVTLEKGRAIAIAKNIVISEDTFDYTYKTVATVSEMQAAINSGTDRK